MIASILDQPRLFSAVALYSVMTKDVQQQSSDGGSKSQSGTERRQFTLTAAKDRAQLTATTAMSVVHVALLKSLVDGGPDANRYYAVVVVLIVVALAIQVVIGILAIFVTQTRKYYQKYHSDMSSEFRAYWCKCLPCCNTIALPTVVGRRGLDNLGFDATPAAVNVAEEVVGSERRSSAAATDDPAWTLRERTMSGLDAVARNVYVSTSIRLLQAELAAIEAEAQLSALYQQLERETKRRENVAAGKTNESRYQAENGSSDVSRSLQTGLNEAGSAEETSQEKERSESDKRLMKIEAGIIKCESTIQQLKVLRRQNELLDGYIDDSQANDVLKKVQFWQNIINYLLYIVFICNAFITGLGVSGGVRGTATSDNGTTTGGQTIVIN